MPDFSCYVTVRNESNSDLLLADFGLEGDGGEWPLYQPLNTIEARTSDTIHLKDRVGNYGSKGWVLFETEVGNRTEQLRLKFADPIELFSKNYIEVWSSNNNRLRGNVTRANANDHPFYAEVVVRSDPNMLAEEEDSPPIDIAVAPKTKDIPMHASFEIGFDIPGPGEKHPIHESIAIAAFIRSELKFPRATTYNNLNHKQWEYFRGMIWNDDPDCLLFDDSASDNRDFGLGAEWWKEFKTGSENRMTRRSHFGDLQFLHAMGSRERELPHYTRDRLLQWMGVMYRLACGDQGISEHHKLGDHFGPEYFDHSTIPSNDRSFRELILATTPNYRASNVAQRALGVCMHMIGDSYAVGHVQRRLKNPGDFAGRDRDGYLNFKAGTWGQWGPIVSFHTYGNQKESRHSFYDGLEGADLPNPKDLGSYNRLHGARDAIEGCILLMNAFARKQPWDELRKKLEEGIFAIDEHAKPCNADVDGKVPGLDFASAMEPVQPSQYYDDAAYMRKLSALESNSQTTPDLRQGTNKFWLRLDVGLRSLFLILLGIIAISFLVFSTLLQK